MKPKVVVGMSPDRLPELRTKLEAQGWNVVEGVPTTETIEKTIFLTDTVPPVVDDYDVLSVGLNISQNQDAQSVVDMIMNQRSTTDTQESQEKVILDESDSPASGVDGVAPSATPDDPVMPAQEPPREKVAKEELAREVKREERNDRRMAFLLS